VPSAAPQALSPYAPEQIQFGALSSEPVHHETDAIPRYPHAGRIQPIAQPRPNPEKASALQATFRT
jgi:hypothetical protein